MYTLWLRGVMLPLAWGLCGAVFAAEGAVSILSPQDGAHLDAMAENGISYKVEPGPRGDHVHLYVDGREVAILRRMQDSYPLPTLDAGEHDLCIKVVNRGHTPIGLEQCVRVKVE